MVEDVLAQTRLESLHRLGRPPTTDDAEHRRGEGDDHDDPDEDHQLVAGGLGGRQPPPQLNARHFEAEWSGRNPARLGISLSGLGLGPDWNFQIFCRTGNSCRTAGLASLDWAGLDFN